MYAMEAIYKNAKFVHNRLKGFVKYKSRIGKRNINDLQALKTIINRHDEDLDILNKIL